MTHFQTRQAKNIGTTLAIALVVFAGQLSLRAEDAAATAAKKETSAAVTNMESWLGDMDSGDYAKCWDEAASSFKRVLTSDQWVDMSKKVRAPLGKLEERKLAGSLYQTGMLSSTGIIPGQFVIAQFDTSFENLKAARETVTFEKEVDGTWRVSGYYIKPG